MKAWYLARYTEHGLNNNNKILIACFLRFLTYRYKEFEGTHLN